MSVRPIPDSRRATFLGVPLDLLTLEETIARCIDLIESGRPAQHVVLNAGKVVLMRDLPDLVAIVAHCDLINADGQAIVWGARWLGIPVPERVAGIDLMGRLIAEAEKRGWPVYFLGARADVLGEFVAEVRRRHPRTVLAGCQDGYFENEGAVADAVAASGARLLFVGISSPRKERFLAENLDRMGPVFAMGVGGAFDVWAGRARRAPVWMQRAGLEWLYRLAQEPGRLWKRYLMGNLRFVALVLRSRFRALKGLE